MVPTRNSLYESYKRAPDPLLSSPAVSLPVASLPHVDHVSVVTAQSLWIEFWGWISGQTLDHLSPLGELSLGFHRQWG